MVGFARRCGHFQFVTGDKSVNTIVISAPVGDDYPGETPLATENFTQQVHVFVGVHTVELVVTAHDGFWVRFGNGDFKCRQVDFTQGALVHDGVGHHAHVFLVVACKVLQAARHACGLHARYVCACHFACKVRIFGKVLEVTSAFRIALDVGAGGKQNVDVKADCFLAERLAHLVHKFRIPTVCHCSAAGEARCRVAGVQSQVVGGGALLTQSAGTVGTKQTGDVVLRQVHGLPKVFSAGKRSLFFQRHFGD